MATVNRNFLIIPCSSRAAKPNGTRGLRRREADSQGLEIGQSVSVGEPPAQPPETPDLSWRNRKILQDQEVMAEAVGFEPTVGFPLRSVSNRVLSASQPRLRRKSFNRVGQRGQGERLGHEGEKACGPGARGRDWRQGGRPRRCRTSAAARSGASSSLPTRSA